MAASDIAISVRNVTKRYKVRHEKGRTLKEAFLKQRIFEDTINALDQVSFDIPRGKTFGIIGSNGSGKSTLLKLIACTSRPTDGSVEVSGRVSALLELGAGFHPDFTGRENIYLDGAIMGLPRKTVAERFDEIVRFAELEEFIDAPAKTYSSGMYLRLAFSVAVSVDPDIVLIDEVFAVGDESFQRKCMERMDRFKREGKTIVFVSHSLDSVRKLCDEALWLEKGRMQERGSTDKVINSYINSVNEANEKRLAAEQGTELDEKKSRWGTGDAEINRVEIFGSEGERHIFSTGDRMRVRISYIVREKIHEPIFGIAIHRSDGIACFGTNTSVSEYQFDELTGSGSIWFEIDDLPFLPGSFQISVSLHNREDTEMYDYHDRMYPFRVVKGVKNVAGIFNVKQQWTGWESEMTVP